MLPIGREAGALPSGPGTCTLLVDDLFGEKRENLSVPAFEAARQTRVGHRWGVRAAAMHHEARPPTMTHPTDSVCHNGAKPTPNAK